MKKIFAVALLLLLVFGAYFLGKREAIHDKALVHDAKKVLELPSSNGPAEKNFAKKDSRQLQNDLPLPQANTPLNEIYGLLQKRADAGDGKAACRLAIELLRCHHSKNVSKYVLAESADISFLTENDSSKDKLSSQNSQDEQRIAYLEKNKSCSDISDDQYKQAFKYLRQAAYAGEPDAVVPYIDGAGLGVDFSFIRGKNFDVWRSDALPLAQSALQRGLPESVVFLSSGYSEDSGFFSALLEDDPFQAEVMRQLYFQLFSVAPSVSVNQLTAEQNRAALDKSKTSLQPISKVGQWLGLMHQKD